MSSSPTLGIGGEAARSESQQGGPEGLRAFLHDAFAAVRRCGWSGARSDPPLRLSQRWGPDCKVLVCAYHTVCPLAAAAGQAFARPPDSTKLGVASLVSKKS